MERRSTEDALTQGQSTQQSDPSGAETFVPRGAIAFMVFLILLYAAVWFGFYSMLTNRP